jgi:putative transposase
VKILQDADEGKTTHAELCKKHSVNINTFYVWRRKYAGLQTDDLKRLRQLEADNAAYDTIRDQIGNQYRPIAES